MIVLCRWSKVNVQYVTERLVLQEYLIERSASSSDLVYHEEAKLR